MARVLVVDDEESIRNTFGAHLRNDGHLVETAGSFKEASCLIHEKVFDVVVADILLPKATGLDVLREIKGISGDTLTVMITGRPSIDTAVEAVREGAFDYLIKPIDGKAIRKAVANATRVKMLRDEKKRLEKENLRYQEHLQELVEERTRELRESEKKYRTLFEAESDTIFLVDEQTAEILDANKAAVQMYGYSKEELRRIKAPDLSAEPARTLKSIYDYGKRKTREEGATAHVPLRYHRKKDGTIFPVEITASHFEFDGRRINISAIRDITERKKIEDALIKNEEKYRRLFQESNDAIFIHDLDGTILDVNEQACEMLGYSYQELHKMPLSTLDPDEAHPSTRKSLQATKKLGALRFESRFRKADDDVIDIEISSRIVDPETGLVQSIARDITERKRAELEMKRRLMKFKLEEGNLYMVPEPLPSLSIEAFKDLLNVGSQGVVISRTPAREFTRELDGEFTFFWLAERGHENTLTPEFTQIEECLERLPRKSCVLMERLDYLVSKEGFRKTLGFVQYLRELCYLKDAIVILSIDPSTLKAEELRLLQKEGKDVVSRHRTELSNDLFDVLKFVYDQNMVGVKPSYGAIDKALQMSKPTLRKKMRTLRSDGYILETKKGSSKVVELTEFGINTILK